MISENHEQLDVVSPPGCAEVKNLVLPFPRWRDRTFVRRHAVNMLALTEKTAGKYLAHQLKVQRQTLERRGVKAAIIDAQITAIEGAILAEMRRRLLLPGGAA